MMRDSCTRPTVLTIAGSDSSGGAGIQADLLTITALGGYGATVISALTAQNTMGVQRVDAVTLPMLQAQIDAVMMDLRVVALKTGMLATAESVNAVIDAIHHHRPLHVVCDPVMVASTGVALVNGEAIGRMRDHLFPLATVVTPNLPELEVLSGMRIASEDDALRAANMLCTQRGYRAVLIKGGHWVDRDVGCVNGEDCTDVLVVKNKPTDAVHVLRMAGARVDTQHTHGTGCVLSASIATHLAHGCALPEAVVKAKAFVTQAIRFGRQIGQGAGPVDPMFVLRESGLDDAHV